MKKVASPLRLELAQFRELAAFSQFSKDLDKATQDQLSRGERLVEMLKQKQFQPMSFEDQIITIMAATKGFTDCLAKNEIGRFKKFLLKYVHQKHPEIMLKLKRDPEFTAELEDSFTEIIRTFLETVYRPQYHPEELKPLENPDETKDPDNSNEASESESEKV
jgi:F-type H+-transporting ATPase subunit alpha